MKCQYIRISVFIIILKSVIILFVLPTFICKQVSSQQSTNPCITRLQQRWLLVFMVLCRRHILWVLIHEMNTVFLSGIVIRAVCSHLKALLYFTASINDNDFLAYPCDSLDDYRKGACTSCGSGCNHMGYHATSETPGLLVLDTGSDYPFNLDTPGIKTI